MSNLREIFPDFLAESLDLGIAACGRKIHGFDRPDAILSGVESRTSSPVRISRNEQMEVMSGGFILVEKVPAMPGGLLQLQWTVCGWPRLFVKKYCL